MKALTIQHSEDVVPVLKEALSAKEPVLVHCQISPDENVLPMVPAGGSVENPISEMD